MSDPSLKDVESFLASNGKRGSMTISLLGKLNPFMLAMKSPVGQEILRDDIDRHEELLKKMYEENITPQELAEFRYLKGRLKKVSDRISLYLKSTNEVMNKNSQGGNRNG